jgi:hypothetical protein
MLLAWCIQLSTTRFHRRVREHQLLDLNSTYKLRQSSGMRHANELCQADTMYGPYKSSNPMAHGARAF